MQSQKSLTLEKPSASEIPAKWRPKYLLKRIGEEDITISLETRDEILKQLANGGRFVQIGEYTIMLNGMKSIDPYWGARNIPPCPASSFDYRVLPSGSMGQILTNKEEIGEWKKCFGHLAIEAWSQE